MAYRINERGQEYFLPFVPGLVVPNMTTTPDVDELFGEEPRSGGGRPIIIQNVMDGRVVGEVIVGYLQGRMAWA